MNVKTAKLIYNECKITLQRVLRCSRNEEARKLYEMTAMKNVNSDTIVNKAFSQDLPNNKIKDKCKSIVNKEITESVWDNFMGLKEKCILIEQIIEVFMVKDIQSWQILVKRLSINIHNLCRRYLVMSLTNNSNLKRWTISNSKLRSLCTKKQTFNHCLQELNRYTWRHNSIIQTFCDHLLKPRDTVQIPTTKSHNYRSATKRSITLCETRYCHLVNTKRLDIKKLKASSSPLHQISN